MAWNERQSIIRILRKLDSNREAAVIIAGKAYSLRVEFALSLANIALTLGLNRQTAQSAIRAGRWLNDNDAFSPAQAELCGHRFPLAIYMATATRKPNAPGIVWVMSRMSGAASIALAWINRQPVQAEAWASAERVA